MIDCCGRCIRPKWSSSSERINWPATTAAMKAAAPSRGTSAAPESTKSAPSGPPTQFHRRELPEHWMCRTPACIGCLNEVSLAFTAAEDNGARWRVLDMWGAGYPRPDSTFDNRHYRCGPAAAAAAKDFLSALATEGGLRKEGKAFQRLLRRVAPPGGLG